ncbi:TatD family hydrolase [Micromonospora globbae]|uniref:TatD family deoxyribonuclease n=1 Tax=Micromonospora globbae TaxID=1894969 RepID=A0A420EJU7_9ACTN|nr:TatD family hydrolase [Micromonospora globbae]RKF20953.1 TatD family deoxyribonuclease [Micromonospora globbae]
MRRPLPPLDLHAHIDVSVPKDDLRGLGAVIFAATRSLEEAAKALERGDETIVWGVGSHPGLARSHTRFDEGTFRSLIERTPYVSEFGLDGQSKVNLDRQRQTLQRALTVLAEMPRVLSLHSYGATNDLLAELEKRMVPGVVLHWWLGDADATAHAVDLGCYFSVNASSARRREVLDAIPLDRLLTETDHPFGDRTSAQPRLPGNVATVEQSLARHHRVSMEDFRRQIWRNLAQLIHHAGCGALLSRRIRAILATVPLS